MVDHNNVPLCLYQFIFTVMYPLHPIKLAIDIPAKSLVWLLNVIVIHWTNCQGHLIELKIHILFVHIVIDIFQF